MRRNPAPSGDGPSGVGAPRAADPSRASIIRAIVGRDLKGYSRDRLWMILTPLVLVVFGAVFWLMPSAVDESFVLGVHQSDKGALVEQFQKGAAARKGLTVVEFPSSGELASAVESGAEVGGPGGGKVTVPAGVDFGPGFAGDAAAGRAARVDVYVSPGAPAEMRGAATAFARELAYSLAGDGPPVRMPPQSEMVLGPDRSGAQVPMREKMRPVIVFMILLTESLALSSLVADEVRTGTAAAMSVTPASTGDIITAKMVTGTVLALGQAVILLAVTRAFTPGNWPMVLAATFLGATLAAGVGVVSGSAGRDFIGTLFTGMAFMVPMVVPAFAVLFPGAPSAWVKVLPSYGVVRALVGATSYGYGWAETLPYLGMAAAWSVALGAAGALALGKKVESS